MNLTQIALAIIALFICFSTLTFLVFNLISNFIGAPFVPTSKKKIKIVLEFADIKKGQRVAELGSGDGRLVVALAKMGAIIDGFEINPILVLASRFDILRLGLRKKASIYLQSFWDKNLSSFDLVVIYGVPSIMPKLTTKISKELKSNSKVISVDFKIPSLKLIKQEDSVYLYQI